MKRHLWLLVLALAIPTLAAPPNWDIANTTWTAQIRDVYYGWVFDGNIRFFTQNTTTGEFTGRVQYLPPNNNPLGQYTISGRVDGDTISFSGVANIPGVGNTDVVWQGTVTQNGAKMQGQMAYWDWIWEVWVVFDWWTTSGGPARPIVRTYTISGKVQLGDWGGDITTVPIVVQLRNCRKPEPHPHGNAEPGQCRQLFPAGCSQRQLRPGVQGEPLAAQGGAQRSGQWSARGWGERLAGERGHRRRQRGDAV